MSDDFWVSLAIALFLFFAGPVYERFFHRYPKLIKRALWVCSSIVIIWMLRNLYIAEYSPPQQTYSQRDSSLAASMPDTTARQTVKDSSTTKAIAKIRKSESAKIDTGDNISITTLNQSGGINIGKLGELNIQGATEPSYTVKRTIDRELRDSLFYSEFLLTLNSQFPLSRFGVIAHSPGISTLFIGNDRVWARQNVLMGSSGDTVLWETFSNPSPGKYRIRVGSKANHPVSIQPVKE
jgi:hypothetical protein